MQTDNMIFADESAATRQQNLFKLVLLQIALLAVLTATFSPAARASNYTEDARWNIAPATAAADFSLRLNKTVRLADPKLELSAAEASKQLLTAIQTTSKNSAIQQGTDPIAPFGQAYWLLAPIRNLSTIEEWAVVTPMPIVRTVESYWVDSEGVITPLSHHVAGAIEAPSNLHFQTVNIAAGDSGYLLLRLQSEYFVLPRVYLNTVPKTKSVLHFHQAVSLIALGAMAALMIYCLVLTFALRNWAYLLYCAFSVTQIAYGILINGYFRDSFSQLVLFSLANLIGMLSLLFTWVLIRPAKPPKPLVILCGFVLVIHLLFFVLWAIPEARQASFSSFTVFSVFEWLVVCAFAASCARHFIPARFLLAAWLLLFFSDLFMAFLSTNLTLNIQVLPLIWSVASVIEMLLLAFAVGSNVRQQRFQRDTALARQREAEKTATQRAEFVSTVSHELNTPLHAILGTIDNLRSQRLPATAKEPLLQLKYAGEALHSLTDSLLGYSALQSEKKPAAQAFSPARIVDAVAGLFQGRADAKNIVIERDVANADSLVTGQPPALRRVLINLVSNAVKYSNGGNVHLHAAIDNNASKSQLICEVTDQGSGVSGELLTQLNSDPTDSLEQIEAIYSNNPSNGLGLNISRTLIREMGGQITFQNRPEGGLHVRLAIPVEQAENQPSTTTNNDLSGIVALAVDDLESNRALTTSYLEQLGCQVITADSASAAKAILTDNQNIELLVTDQRMPGGDGSDLLAWLRQHSNERLQNLPAIIATAHISESLLAGAAELRYDVLAKPFNVEQLLVAATKLRSKTYTASAFENSTTGTDSNHSQHTHNDHNQITSAIAALKRDLGQTGAERVLQLVAQQTRDDIQTITEQLSHTSDDSNEAEWRKLAHKIASATGTLSILTIRDQALQLETSTLDTADSKLGALRQKLAIFWSYI